MAPSNKFAEIVISLKVIFSESITFLGKKHLRTNKAITVFGLGKVGTAIDAVALVQTFWSHN